MIVRGEEGYIHGYDGYALYQEMSWSPLQAPQEGRGLFTTIPSDSRVFRQKGYAGWACFYNDNRTYDCGRYHVTEEQFFTDGSIDLLNGDYQIDRGFMCYVNQDYIAYHTAKCINFLPDKSDNYPVGEYRWSPHAIENFSQYGFVGERDAWFNQWIQLGQVEFLGAMSGLMKSAAGVAVVVAASLMF